MKTKSFLILGIILIIVTSLVVSSLINISINSSTQKEKISKNLLLHSEHIVNGISLVMHERISDLKFLTDPKNSIISSSDTPVEEKTEYLRMFERATKTYTSISIYDLSGKKIIDTRNFELGVDASDDLFFTNAIKGELFYDPVPVYVESLNTQVLHFSAPIYDENEMMTGVLVTTFPVYRFHQIISEPKGAIPEGAEIDLISKDGLVLYSTHDRSSILTEKSSIQTLMEQNPLDAFNTYGIFEKNFEEEYFYVLTSESGHLSYPGNDWHILVSLPTSIAFAELENSQNTLYLITLMFLVLSVILSIFLSNRISKPIQELTKATKRIQNNELKQLSVVKGTQEIKELSSSFNSMVFSLDKQKKELLELDRAKDEFTSMITHEIKNPLVPIVGYSDMLLEEKSLGSLSEKQRNAMKIILKNSLALERLTSDFLDVQKLDLGKMNFDKQYIPNDYVIDEVYKQHKTLLEQSHVEFKKTISKIKYLYIDETRIMQIFNNLILNSLRYLPDENRKIEIGSFQKDSEIVFYVKDNGSGIPLSQQKNLFKKFHQSDTSITRKHGGTGLGLSISKGIIDAHDGNIWCESMPDVKTTMYFSLPIKEFENVEKPVSENLIQKQKSELIRK